jgi:adenylate cyclase
VGSNFYQHPYLLLRTIQGNRRLPLAGKNCWTIGRSSDNDFVLSDHWVSRNHAMLQQTDAGDYYLVDLGSRNGTFVNGRRVTFPMHLHHLDQISFGLTRIEFYSAVEPQEHEIPDHLQKATLDTHHYERRLVSALVVNIHDFTLLTQATDESIVSQLMSDWLRQSNQILRQSDCLITKYISDTIIGIWSHNNSLIFNRVVQILKVTRDLTQMTHQLAEKYGLTSPIKLGIGIGTGYATVNKIVGNEQFQYNVLGKPVNTAIRLQYATRKLAADVVLGEETYQTLEQVKTAALFFRKQQILLKDCQNLSTVYVTNSEQLSDFLVEAF